MIPTYLQNPLTKAQMRVQRLANVDAEEVMRLRRARRDGWDVEADLNLAEDRLGGRGELYAYRALVAAGMAGDEANKVASYLTAEHYARRPLPPLPRYV